MLPPFLFKWRPAWVALAAVVALAGCQTAPRAPDRGTVSADLSHRTGYTVPACPVPGEITLPPGASFDDGLTEDEAVAIALWNNAAFQELLTDLGLTRGDLIQAGLLPNPELLLYFAVPDKPFRYLFDFALESLWLRPVRVKAAAGEADRTASRLAQAGLDLMRDTRQAYADVVLAQERVRVAGEGVTFHGKIAELAAARLKAGDISPQEAATAKIDALQAEQDATRIGYDVPVVTERLRNLMGVGRYRGPLRLDPSPAPPCGTFDVDALTADALATRPDALAATQAVAAAQERVRVAKLGWVRVLGIGDATSGRRDGNELGPGVRVTIPLFNQNQGGIARAEAERERAVRNQQTVANQIVLDVQRAYQQYQQACAERDVLLTKVRPEVDENVRRAQAAYREGNVPYQIALETTRQLLDSLLREAVLTGDLRRAWAELERSAGRRLTIPAATTTAIPSLPPPSFPSVPPPVTPAATVSVPQPVPPVASPPQPPGSGSKFYPRLPALAKKAP
jgi:cobalt-zinc-cadmium efflux system outer membrane protein